jgi:hypothetical protein
MAIKESPFQREEYYRQFKKMRIGLGKGFGAIEMDMTGVARVLGDVAILMESTRSEKFINKIEKFIYDKAYLSLINAKQYGRGGKRFKNVKKASADHYDKLKKMFPNIYEPEPPGQVTGTLIDTMESNPKKIYRRTDRTQRGRGAGLDITLAGEGISYPKPTKENPGERRTANYPLFFHEGRGKGSRVARPFTPTATSIELFAAREFKKLVDRRPIIARHFGIVY